MRACVRACLSDTYHHHQQQQKQKKKIKTIFECYNLITLNLFTIVNFQPPWGAGRLCRLQPLLAEIEADRHNVAMAVLDYVDAKTLQYSYNRGFAVRYGFDWRLFFFETLPKLPPGKISPVDPYPLVPGIL